MALINQRHIKQAFNKASHTYHHACYLQLATAQTCLKLLSPVNTTFQHIADLACGPGVSTECLIENLNHKTCYAIDFADKLIEVAQQRLDNPAIRFMVSDLHDLEFLNHKLDLVFCNMALQWSYDLNYSFRRLRSYLTDGGMLLFSIPLLGSLSALKNHHKNPFPTLDHLHTLLKTHQFTLRAQNIKTYHFSYPTPLAALQSIKQVGANRLLKSSTKRAVGLSRRHLNDVFTDNQDVTLNYNIAHILVSV